MFVSHVIINILQELEGDHKEGHLVRVHAEHVKALITLDTAVQREEQYHTIDENCTGLFPFAFVEEVGKQDEGDQLQAALQHNGAAKGERDIQDDAECKCQHVSAIAAILSQIFLPRCSAVFASS